MKQLSSSELNHLSKEDMAAMILQLQQQNAILMERLAVSDAHRFGRKTEKLDTLPGSLKLFNEASEQELTDIFGANGWKRLPDEVYSRLEY